MRKITLALFAAVAMLAGCALPVTGQVAVPAPTVGQFLSQVCPPAQTVITDLQAMGADIPQNVQDRLTTISPIVIKACTAGATVSIVSVQDFAKTTIPGLLSLVESSHMSQDKKGEVVAALIIVQAAVSSVR